MTGAKSFPVFHSSSSKLVLIMGPMFSGKTTSLISELTRYVDVDIPVVYINSAEDTRGEFFSTHNSSYTHVSSKIKTLKSNSLISIDPAQLDNFGVLAIDEAQFFPDLIAFVKFWLKRKKVIYVAGLDGDIQQKLFGDIVHLIPYATEVKKLCAVCETCRKQGKIVNAPMTIRYDSNSMDTKVIGGKDIYFPVCHDCLQKSQPNDSNKKETQEQCRDLISELNYVI